MTKRIRQIISCLLLTCVTTTMAQVSHKLTGTPIGSNLSVDYSTGQASTKVNYHQCAFDGNLNTYFASYDRSYTWVGLDLGTPHVITQVGWSPRNDSQGEGRVKLALFEGSNSLDFHDAFPLYLIDQSGTIGVMSHHDVDVSLGFRYVRYVGPHNARCNIAELEFYGYESEGDSTHFHQLTNLPTVSIHTLNSVEPYDKEHEIDSWVTNIYDDGSLLQHYPITTRLRGNASMGFEKKPYRIKFADGKKHHMLKDSELESPAKAKKWTLINNYGDKTLMRNMLAFELSRQFQISYTPWCQPVDVILNGEYKGCYQLTDQVEVGSDRVDITKMEPTDNEGIPLTGGYLLEIDAYASSEPSKFYSNKGIPVTIKYPDSDEITDQQRSYIKGYFNLMETRLWSNTYTSTQSGVSTILDCQSFASHFLVGETSGNTDTYWSTYVSKERDEDLLQIAPVWDFDLAFENDDRTYPIITRSGNSYVYATMGSYAGSMRQFVNRLMSATFIQNLVKDTWISARRRGLTADSFCEYIDSLATELDQSQRLNFMRWNIMNQRVHQNPRILGSYKAEVSGVKTYVKDRFNWMDKKLNYNPLTDDILDIAGQQTEDNAIYDLSGRRVPVNTTGRGIYIRNGKKILLP